MMAERRRNISWRGDAPHVNQNGNDRQSGACGKERKRARAPAYPVASLHHRATQQQGEGGITRHRVVFLRCGKCEEDEYENRPTERDQTDLSGTINWLER